MKVTVNILDAFGDDLMVESREPDDDGSPLVVLSQGSFEVAVRPSILIAALHRAAVTGNDDGFIPF